MPAGAKSQANAALSNTIGIATVLTLYVAVAFGFGLYLFAFLVTKMREDLGFDYAAIGLVTGGAQVSYLAASVLCPRLVDRAGGGATIVYAVATSGALLILFACVRDVAQVGAVLAGLGAAAALMVVPTVGVISRVVPFAHRSRVNGLVSSGTAYGQFANGLVVPWLLPERGWRVVWLDVGLAAFAVAGLGFLALRLLARDALARDAAHTTKRVSASAERGEVLTRPNLILWVLFALNGMACGPWQNYIASFLADERQWTTAMIGQVWSIIGIVGLFSGFAAGMAADVFGVRVVLACSYAVLATSALLVALPADAWQVRVAAACFGLSFYAVYGLIPAYITKTVGPRSAVTVFAVANVFLGAGTTLGNVLGGLTPSMFGTLRHVFLAASGLAIVGAIMTTALQDERASVL